MHADIFIYSYYLFLIAGVLCIAAFIADLAKAINEHKSANYKFANVGCVLRPRKKLMKLILEIFK